MTEHNPTELDTAPDTHSFVDNGAEDLEPEYDAEPTPGDSAPESGDAAGDSDSDSAEAAPQTGSGSAPAESGEPNPPESTSRAPQTSSDDEADGVDPSSEPAAHPSGDSTPGDSASDSAPGDSASDSGDAAGDSTPGDTDSASGDSASGDSGSGEGEGGVLDEDHLPPGQTEVPVGEEVVIDDDTMRRALEAILMVTDEPLPVLTLARAVGRPTGDVSAALETLAEEYTEQGRGFDLREVGGGWRYYTRVEAAPYVERFVLDGQQARLTQAALETLAVVAYKQPVSRARVSAIRGVNVDGVMRTLVARGLVEEAGSDTESQATLYRTTSYFLERMGMQSLDDLPELAPYLPEMDDVEEELAAQTIPTTETPADDATPDQPAAEPAHADPTAEADQAPAEPGDADTQPEDAASHDVPGEYGAAGDAEVEDAVGEDVPSEYGAAGDAKAEDAAGAEYAQAGEPAGEDVGGGYAAGDAGDETGIDGDLSTDESVDLDLEHEPGELEPSDELEPAEDDDETGIDGDLSTGEPVDLDLEHEPDELDPSDEVESAEAVDPAEAEAEEPAVDAAKSPDGISADDADRGNFGDARRDG
ncbi:segregation and condensation protein B [Kribbella antiqua]|uniref:Segregation and condensation protein B n=1 Tax=Kribbella antiqua TaxID=2512217 RepID=A0A4R2IJB4_9ACTN|nr:segregation and condensation protein B [Kribbella antiqua]